MSIANLSIRNKNKMKLFIPLLFCFLVFENITKGQQSDTLPIYKTKYQYIVFKINDKYLNYTDMISIFGNYNLLLKGFSIIRKDSDSMDFFYNGKNYKHQYYQIPIIDTIDNVKWVVDSNMYTMDDSTCFDKKIEYSFLLNKFNEKRLNEDSIRKMRLLFPEDMYVAQKKWRLYKILFYQDSAVLIKKISDIIDTTGRGVTESKVKILNNNEKAVLLSTFDDLLKFDGLECTTNKLYPWLLEYYDGNSEHYYFYSRNSHAARKTKKQCDILIHKILRF
jgi:hypothetical protein